MKLDEALERAKQLRGTLFIGKIFYVTPKTKVDFKLLKSVVTTHGGQVGSLLANLILTFIAVNFFVFFQADTTVPDRSLT
jgi:hypothetical protein